MPSTQEEAYATKESLVRVCRGIHTSDLEIAYHLWKLKRYELWYDSFGGIDTWEDFLKQPEINIPVSKANKLIKIYDFFGEEHPGYDISGIAISRLYTIASHVEDGKKIHELLTSARESSTADFKEYFRDVTVGEERTYSYMVMKKCNETGNLTKVHGLDSEIIKDKLNLE